ncbi:MAG: glycosyltransferase family 2 protein [Muribaculaceae bacterium]|nr:glycosyltransferase family 2 protein [Muribaculaceae bacterium]
MDISIIIVSYRVKYFLEQTIRAAQEALNGIDGEIIVVDNNSPDDTMAFVKPRFPQVKFVENKTNPGFAKANNQGIDMAQGEFTLILNPDTIITVDSIKEPLAWMRNHPKCGAIGVHMIDGDGRFLPESKRAFPSPWVSFCKIFGLSKLFPKSRIFAKYHLRFLDEHKPHAVDILAGAYMLCRTSLLRQLKGFDEDFFMYGEDIDLSYRMVQAGYENWYLPVDMIHYKGESTKKDSMRYVRVFYEAMLIFYRKHYPRYSWIGYPIVQLGVALRASMAMLKRLLKRILPTKSPHPANNAPWVILSDNRARVTMATGLNHFKTAIPKEGPAQVMIDDATYSYSDIVNIISTHARRGVEFHIFSSANELIISPKMSQS